jgi:hypothetical protein
MALQSIVVSIGCTTETGAGARPAQPAKPKRHARVSKALRRTNTFLCFNCDTLKQVMELNAKNFYQKGYLSGILFDA